MVDAVVDSLTAYVAGVGSELDADVAREVERRLLDTVGVALGSLHEPATRATRRYLYSQPASPASRVWGTGLTTTPELAALVNGTAARCLDFNDAYFGRDGSHPSDVIPGLVAVAEQRGRSGAELAHAIAITYEVIVSLSDAIGVRGNGLDHVTTTSIGACCGLGRLFGLSRQQLADALAITIVPHVATRQTRRNQLTMWKGIAAGNSVRNAVDACAMAAAGVGGPSDPFEGDAGWLNVAALDGVDWDRMATITEQLAPRRILDTHIKLWPVGYLAQAAVDVAIDVHQRLASVDDIAAIKISTFDAALDIMHGPQMWAPETPETADHSLVYATTAALLEGDLTDATFHSERLVNSGIREVLAERVEIEALDEFSRKYPEAHPARVTVTTTSGDTISAEADYPRGHAMNRATPAQLRAKFDRLVVPSMGPVSSDIAAAVEELQGWDDLRSFTDLLVL